MCTGFSSLRDASAFPRTLIKTLAFGSGASDRIRTYAHAHTRTQATETTMQSLDRSLVDALIKDTVRCVLFGDGDRADEAPSTAFEPSTCLSNKQVPNQEKSEEDAGSLPSSPLPSQPTDVKSPRRKEVTDAQVRRLLRQLFTSRCDGDQDEDDGSGERGPEQVEATLISQQQVLQCCCQWSREMLASAKAALKAFLRSVSTHDCKDDATRDESPASDTPGDGETRPDRRYAQVYETYALVKLFLLEKDERYRAQKIAEPRGAGSRTAKSGITMGGGDSSSRSAAVQHRFLVLLRVQLALYAHYFELANGRKITQDADVRPVQSLYAHFLAHRRLLATG